MDFCKGKRRISCLGEDDAKESEKSPLLWIANDEADADCITSVSHKGLHREDWLRVQQKVEAAASSMPLGSFKQRAIASTMALQSIPTVFQLAQDQSASQLQPVKKVMQQQFQSQQLRDQQLLQQQQQLQKQQQLQQQQFRPIQQLQQQQAAAAVRNQQFQQQQQLQRSTPQPSGSLISDAGNHMHDVSTFLTNKNSEGNPFGNIAISGVFVQDSEMAAASCLRSLSRETPTPDAQHMMPGSYIFSSNWNEQTDQLGNCSLPMQQNSHMYISSVKEQEQELVLPSTVQPAAPAMASIDELDSFGMVSTIYGKQQPMSGCYCAPTTDPFTSLNSVNVIGNFVSGSENQHQNLPVAPLKATTRTYTKIYKLGSIGRAVDVNRFKNYTELRCELAQMFGLEGQLDTKSGWQLVFIDNENDILLVGDDPWEVFVSTVRGIRILSPSEVAYYMSSDERVAVPNYNCLHSSVMRRF